MMNVINWSTRAFRQLTRLPKVDQVKIRNSINEKLPQFPDCTEVKALKGHKFGYRLRIGNFRVLFDFDGMVKIVSIQEVRKRNERTY